MRCSLASHGKLYFRHLLYSGSRLRVPKRRGLSLGAALRYYSCRFFPSGYRTSHRSRKRVTLFQQEARPSQSRQLKVGLEASCAFKYLSGCDFAQSTAFQPKHYAVPRIHFREFEHVSVEGFHDVFHIAWETFMIAK